jgi:hypothetical protein
MRCEEWPESALPRPSPRDPRRSAIPTRSSHSTCGRTVGYGSRAAVIARVMVRPVWPQLRKCPVRPGSYAWCQLPTSGEPPLTTVVEPSQSPSLGDGSRPLAAIRALAACTFKTRAFTDFALFNHLIRARAAVAGYADPAAADFPVKLAPGYIGAD